MVRARFLLTVEIDCSPSLPAFELTARGRHFQADLYQGDKRACLVRLVDHGLRFACSVNRSLLQETVYCDRTIDNISRIILRYYGGTFNIKKVALCNLDGCTLPMTYLTSDGAEPGLGQGSNDDIRWTLYQYSDHLIQLSVGCDQWATSSPSHTTRIRVSKLHYQYARGQPKQSVSCHGEAVFANSFCRQIDFVLRCKRFDTTKFTSIGADFITNSTVTVHQVRLCVSHDCASPDSTYTYSTPTRQSWTPGQNVAIRMWRTTPSYTLTLDVQKACCPGCENGTLLFMALGNKERQCYRVFFNWTADACGLMETNDYCWEIPLSDVEFLHLNNAGGDTITVNGTRLCNSTGSCRSDLGPYDGPVQLAAGEKTNFYDQWRIYWLSVTTSCRPDASSNMSQYEEVEFVLWDQWKVYSQCKFTVKQQPLQYCKQWTTTVPCRVFTESNRTIQLSSSSAVAKAFIISVFICEKVSVQNDTCDSVYYSWWGVQAQNSWTPEIRDNYGEYWVKVVVDRPCGGSPEPSSYATVRLQTTIEKKIILLPSLLTTTHHCDSLSLTSSQYESACGGKEVSWLARCAEDQGNVSKVFVKAHGSNTVSKVTVCYDEECTRSDSYKHSTRKPVQITESWTEFTKWTEVRVLSDRQYP